MGDFRVTLDARSGSGMLCNDQMVIASVRTHALCWAHTSFAS